MPFRQYFQNKFPVSFQNARYAHFLKINGTLFFSPLAHIKHHMTKKTIDTFLIFHNQRYFNSGSKTF